jgi:uncharacterized membrane protein YqgA involved in biofilm formation
VIGTVLNVAGILIGGIVGLVRKTPMSQANQSFLKIALAVFTVFYGLRLVWISFNGPFLNVIKQFIILFVALVLGKVTGRLLRLQKSSNRIGQFARDRMASAVRPGNPRRFVDGLVVCSLLFCAAPLGIFGAISDGLLFVPGSNGYCYPLAVKGVMDGLGTMCFVGMFGWGVMLSAIPVLVVEGGIAFLCMQYLRPFLEAHHLVEPINLVSGMLIFCVSLLILEIRKIEVTDYLPSLVYAPVIAWVFRGA